MSIRRHAERLTGMVTPTLAAAISASPIIGARQLGLIIEPVERLDETRGARGWCDGVSFLKAGVTIYVRSPNSRREHFTIAHEIGHWLVDRDDDAVDWLADLRDPARALEQLCDQIAGRLLVTDEILDSLIGTQSIQATDIRRLYEQTTASEPVCAIALTRRLHTPGAIVLLDRTGFTVSYASLIWDHGDEQPIAYPWAGQHIPVGHRLRNLAVGAHMQSRSWWATPWGEWHTYYLDAVSGQNRIAAILAETDIWGCERLHLDQPGRRPASPVFTIQCTCGFTGEARGYPHDECGRPFCPQCGACECDRKFAGHKPCAKCFVQAPARDLVDGLCSMCR
jgi:hypothetical protein